MEYNFKSSVLKHKAFKNSVNGVNGYSVCYPRNIAGMISTHSFFREFKIYPLNNIDHQRAKCLTPITFVLFSYKGTHCFGVTPPKGNMRKLAFETCHQVAV